MSMININEIHLLPQNAILLYQVETFTKSYDNRKQKIENSNLRVDQVINKGNVYEKISSIEAFNQQNSNLLDRVISCWKNFFHWLDQRLNPITYLGAEAATIRPSIQKKPPLIIGRLGNHHWLG